VAFQSAADLLSGDDTNDVTDIYVHAAQTPHVADVAPDTVARGTTVTLTVTGNGFFPGARAHIAGAANGATATSTTVLSETELQVSITIDAGAATGKRTLVVWNPGTGLGALAPPASDSASAASPSSEPAALTDRQIFPGLLRNPDASVPPDVNDVLNKAQSGRVRRTHGRAIATRRAVLRLAARTEGTNATAPARRRMP
jgi:hypothetical protein